MQTLASLALAVVVLLSAGASGAYAQAAEEPEVLISIFRIAPGQHRAFLEWQAEQTAIASEAGGPEVQWYVHHNGDSWDFLSIQSVQDPAAEAATDDRIEELSRQRGQPTGFAGALEFRQFVSFHTDTYAGGPFTAQELVQQATQR